MSTGVVCVWSSVCGSAAVKKELRDAFERDSTAVSLTEELYPDVNVITGPFHTYFIRILHSPHGFCHILCQC